MCELNPATVVTCPSVDDSACSHNACAVKTGKCTAVALADGATCDADGSDCTQGDNCKAGVCKASVSICQCKTDSDCVTYDDANLCNGSLYCNPVLHTCIVNPATIVQCPFGLDSACAVNTCDPQSGTCAVQAVNSGGPCEADGNPCTPYDSCAAGICAMGANVCECQTTGECAAKEDNNLCNGTLVCDPAAKACVVNPASTVTCTDDGSAPCMRNQCQPSSGACKISAVNQGKWCDADANPCTLNDTCVSGSCQLGTNICACELDGHCDGKDDASLCNGLLYCDKSVAPFGCAVAKSTIVVCSSAGDSSCLKNQCQTKTGKCAASAVTVGTSCDDGNLCTGGDACKVGLCAGTPKVCADGDPCTLDSCLTKSGVCGYKVANCDDGNACTTDSCDGQKGCFNSAVVGSVPCDDGDLCSQPDSCLAGACSGTKLSCDDGKPCTTDSCNGVTGCINATVVDGQGCSDGDKCSQNDVCKASACKGIAIDCDDTLVCTADVCDPKTGCTFVAKVGPCNDDSACTKNDICQADGSCKGTATSCDDGNPCTDDGCDLKTGCTVINHLQACSHANLCLSGTTCKGGLCQGGVSIDCDDKVACTVDSCEPDSGCVQLATDSLCDDGDLCTSQACDAKKGCSNPVLPDATPCGSERFCASGLCVWATQLDVGLEFACALRADRTVWCWGKGEYGEIGNNKSGTSGGIPQLVAQPSLVQGLVGAVQVCAGYHSVCAATLDGQGYCWGYNTSYGQLGIGTSEGIAATAKPMKGLTTVVQVAAGYNGTCARLANGDVHCAGDNSYGQLGLGGTIPIYASPAIKSGFSGASALALGHSLHCALIGDKVTCAGWNTFGQMGTGQTTPATIAVPTTVATPPALALTTGEKHVCALLKDGTAMCWGGCAFDQLGGGKSCPSNSVVPAPEKVLGLTDLRHIDAGYHNTCAVKTDGTVWCWGANANAQVGDGGAMDQIVPRQVVGLPACVSVAAGDAFSCARDPVGQVYCWGNGQHGGLGDGNSGDFDHVQGYATLVPASKAPTASVCKLTNCDDGDPCTTDGCTDGGICTHTVASDGLACGDGNACQQGVCKWAIGVAAGLQHTCALRSTGVVACWGRNLNGQLGNGTFGSVSALPTAVQGASDGVQIAAGGNTTCMVQKGGTVLCWGAGEACLVGGSVGDQAKAVAVPGLTNIGVVAVGNTHACAMHKVSGAVYCWGSNSSGEVGDDAASFTPVCQPKIALGVKPTTVKVGRLALGTGFSVATADIGYAYFWGTNDMKQLTGQWPQSMLAKPAALSQLPWLFTTAGKAFGCAVGLDGKPKCWGDNNKGQVTASATGTVVAQPTLVSAAPVLTALAAGGQHVCGIGTNKTAYCWGAAQGGQLGQGKGPSTGVVAVAGLPGVAQLAAGGDHTCALDTAGQVWCWGEGNYGELGAGQAGPGVQSPTPLLVAASAAAIKGSVCQVAGHCDDGDPCTADVCNAKTGQCDHPAAADGVQCGATGSNKLCASGQCKTPFAIDMALGWGFTCVRRATGALMCAGSNSYGQLGANLVTTKIYPNFESVVGFATGAVSIAAKDNQACAVRADGKVWCWGSNFNAALGNNAPGTSYQAVPVEVVGAANKVGVAMGVDTACAWSAAGQVHCWGRNDLGQVGNGLAQTSAPQFQPSAVAVAQLTGAVQVAVADVHACARTGSNALYCWGIDTGLLGGEPSGKAVATPQLASLAPPVAGLAIHTSATAILTLAGTVHAWTGNSQYGLPGYYYPFTYKTAAAPKVPVLGKVSQLVAGQSHFCALLVDGKVACWGSNGYGEANPSYKFASLPRPVVLHGVGAVAKLFCGREHCCALRTDGSLGCWGTNYYGEFGNGTSSQLPGVVVPVVGTGPQ